MLDSISLWVSVQLARKIGQLENKTESQIQADVEKTIRRFAFWSKLAIVVPVGLTIIAIAYFISMWILFYPK